MDVKSKKAFLFDIEGVLLVGKDRSRALKGMVEVVDLLKSRGKKVAVITNISTHTREEVHERLKGMGYSFDFDKLFIAAHRTGTYLKEKFGPCKCYLIGEDGFKKELEAEGHKIVTENADTVVVGLDRQLTYEKLNDAARFLLKHPGLEDRYGPDSQARLVACHGSQIYMESDGPALAVEPITRGLSEATGVEAITVGKPEPFMFEMALNLLGVEKEEAVMIGDSLESDIKGARATGIDSILLLTGIHSREDIGRLGIEPTLVVEDGPALLELLKG